MGRLKPQSYCEVKRRYEAVGFVVRRSGIADAAVVPRKPEIPVGTLHSILSQAHITHDDWEQIG